MTPMFAWAMTGLLCDPTVVDSMGGIVCLIDTWAKGYALSARCCIFQDCSSQLLEIVEAWDDDKTCY